VLTAKLPSVDYDFHQLAPADIEINVDVSVPWYVWLVPGAMLGLPIAISGAKADASRKTNKMINDIVDLLNGWFSQTSVQPPRMDKHDAGFYVSPPGNELFWINFCPVPGRVPVRVQ
jgi:hypothetical protein